MKRLWFFLFASLGVISSASPLRAQELRISGNIDVISGWQQHKNSGALSTTNQGFISDLERQGGIVAAATANADDRSRFNFYLDQVELDLEQLFGENIRLRTDIDVSRTRDFDSDGVADGSISLEQGYVTANIAAGMGAELAVGRFNMPIGTESVDRNELAVIGFSPLRLAGIRPINGTGARIYYPFSERYDFHFYIVNTLGDSAALATNKPVPSAGFRYGINWGEEEKRSTFGISAAAGSEQPDGTGGTLTPLTFLADLDLLIAMTSNSRMVLEGIYRQDNSPAGAASDKFVAALMNWNYDFSDIWDGTFQYSFNKAFDGAGNIVAPGYGYGPGGTAGAKVDIHDLQVALNYDVTDGARVKIGGNYQILAPDTGSTAKAYGAAAEFAYSF